MVNGAPRNDGYVQLTDWIPVRAPEGGTADAWLLLEVTAWGAGCEATFCYEIEGRDPTIKELPRAFQGRVVSTKGVVFLRSPLEIDHGRVRFGVWLRQSNTSVLHARITFRHAPDDQSGPHTIGGFVTLSTQLGGGVHDAPPDRANGVEPSHGTLETGDDEPPEST